MKKIKISNKILAALAVCVFTVSVVNAQTPDANAPAPPPPPVNSVPAPPPPAPRQQLQQVATYKGSVIKLFANDDYVYDGFYMLNNSDTLLIKFPPHLGTQITGAIKPGSTVTVNGVMNIAPMGRKEIRMISVDAGSKTISDTGAIAATPPVETYVSGNGKITQLQTNRDGIVTGFIVDGKTILRIPPQAANQLASAAQTNASVSYAGLKKPVANNGEVSLGDYAIIHCQTLTLNGQQYLLR